MIKYLQNKEIDYSRWDNAIYESVNGLIYANSWYLDVVSENWDAIILDDYKAVMPIVWTKKYFLKYVYQPFFTQQLGAFFRDNNSSDFLVEALELLRKKFSYVHMNCNYMNHLVDFQENTNYVLNLNRSYENISANYKKNHIYSLKKSYQNKLTFEEVSFDTLMGFKKKYLTDNLKLSDLERLGNVVKACLKNEKSNICGVFQNGELLSVAFFVFYKNTYYYLIAANSEKGRKLFSSHFLLDSFIKSNANTPTYLNFEGSNIPGVAKFFKSWGAENVEYYTFKENNLSSFVKIFKN
ncbi:MAG: hypothetical protein JXL97_10945 [Bacteroidales bacterium]|nr:hypothetical protein [Bacteroidales bacterium]